MEEGARAEALLLRNVSPPGALPGCIVASPSLSNPDYYYHWVRDSGIAMRAVLSLYHSARTLAARQRYLGLLLSFVDFSRHIQRTATTHGIGLGEPKFTVGGEPYSGIWARPQDDGPAIRAIELIELAFTLLDEGEGALVREKLYDGRLPTDSVIKADLEYVAHRWSETCFDVWEEIRGHHFATQHLERSALVDGAELATKLGDTGAATFYVEQSRLMEPRLREYWDPRKGYIVATRDPDTGERSGLDSAVIIATLIGDSIDGVLQHKHLSAVDHERVLTTIVALEQVFATLYPINDPSRKLPGIAIGRYPEDRYDGYHTNSVGNPWFGITVSFAMFYYKLVRRYRKLQSIAVTDTSIPFLRRLASSIRRPLRPGEVLAPGDPDFDETLAALGRRGDTFLQRVRCHIGPEGSMDEQLNRVTGFQQGAADLSANYAVFLRAAEARRAVHALDPWPAP